MAWQACMNSRQHDMKFEEVYTSDLSDYEDYGRDYSPELEQEDCIKLDRVPTTRQVVFQLHNGIPCQQVKPPPDRADFDGKSNVEDREGTRDLSLDDREDTFSRAMHQVMASIDAEYTDSVVHKEGNVILRSAGKRPLPPFRQKSRSRSTSPRKGSISPLRSRKGSISPIRSPKKGLAGSWDCADINDVPFEHPDAMDADRVYVWRSNEWHPVSPYQDYQIKTQLASGRSVFDIYDGPCTWTIDTTPEEGWRQISKSTGKRRAMKCQQALDSSEKRGPQIGVPTVSSISMATPFVDREQSYNADDFGEDAQLITRFREEWHNLLDTVNATPSTEGRLLEELREKDLHTAWLASCRAHAAAAEYEDKELIGQTIADAFLKMDLSRNHRIEETEWLHYWLLENQAPSFHALSQVNENLLEWLKHEPTALARLLELFLRMCAGREDAQLTAKQMRLAAQDWLLQDKKAISYAKKRNKSANRCEFRKRSVAHLQELLNSAEAIDEDEMLTYYQFMNHMLGRKKAKVQIYQYDLSSGKAKWLSPLLVGQQLDGIWHTSVVVHGKEFWYGGRLFESPPGTTPFGSPTKIFDLPEQTMRTYDDFHSFLERELAFDFTEASYDVLTCNCNHFSDAACRFLLNCSIPPDIAMQSDLVKDSWAMKMLRPILNRKLGAFRNDETTGHALVTSMADARGEDDWKGIHEGTLVTWEHDEGWTRIARVISKPRDGQDTCALKWLDLHTGELHTRFDVKRGRVQKLLQKVGPSAGRQRRASDPMVGGTFGARYQRLPSKC